MKLNANLVSTVVVEAKIDDVLFDAFAKLFPTDSSYDKWFVYDNGKTLAHDVDDSYLGLSTWRRVETIQDENVVEFFEAFSKVIDLAKEKSVIDYMKSRDFKN